MWQLGAFVTAAKAQVTSFEWLWWIKADFRFTCPLEKLWIDLGVTPSHGT